jgi:hypothetical protein
VKKPGKIVTIFIKIFFQNFFSTSKTPTVCFTDLDQGREIVSYFRLPKSMKHTVGACAGVCGHFLNFPSFYHTEPNKT